MSLSSSSTLLRSTPEEKAPRRVVGFFSSKPVAMTVTRISSWRVSSKAEPKMMLASGLAASWTMLAAVSTSSRPRSDEPVMLMSTPMAPLMEVSSRGLATAAWAACSALSRPEAVPTPMWARPASFMMADTSAKSRLMFTCSE